MKTVKKVPVLRFPEFEGDWETKKIKSVLKIGSGKDYKHLDTGNIPVYGTGGYMRSVNDHLYEGESIGIGRKGTIDKPIFLTGKFWTVDTLFYTHSFKDAKPQFIFSIFQRINWKKYNEASGVPSLSKATIEKIDISLPSLPEQTKIADFLTSVDTKIQQLRRKKELLEQYKKGSMQKLFSQEIRFKDEQGNEYPEWEEVPLRKIAIKVKSKNTDQKIMTVLTNSATQGIVSQNDYFDKDIANQNNLGGYYVVERNDFVYNPRISVHAPVGPLGRNNLDRGVMSPLYTVIRFKKGNLDFYEKYFKASLWHKYMCSVANYGARHDRMNISSADFFNLPLPFPCLEEQNKIADFLTAIDKKINFVDIELEQLNTWKTGLLQQLFV